MTAENPMERGAKSLYNEDVTPRTSPAFDIISAFGLGFLKKILGGAGKIIDNATGWITKYIPQEKEQNGYTGNPQPAMASGYRMAMAREAIPSGYTGQTARPRIIRIQDYMSQGIADDCTWRYAA